LERGRPAFPSTLAIFRRFAGAVPHFPLLSALEGSLGEARFER